MNSTNGKPRSATAPKAKADRGSKATATRSSSAPGEILESACYTLREFQARTQLGRWAVRQLVRAGLRTRKAGGRTFLLGRDWIGFLQEDRESHK